MGHVYTCSSSTASRKQREVTGPSGPPCTFFLKELVGEITLFTTARNKATRKQCSSPQHFPAILAPNLLRYMQRVLKKTQHLEDPGIVLDYLLDSIPTLAPMIHLIKSYTFYTLSLLNLSPPI